MSMVAYARHRGCSRAAVHKAIQSGRISRDAASKTAGGHWRIDAEKADLEWAKSTTRESAADAQGRRREAAASVDDADRRFRFAAADIPVDDDGRPLSRVEVQTIRDAIAARREQIELAELRGELVRKDEVTRRVAEISRTTVNQILAVPARVSKTIASVDDPAAVEIALEEALVDALTSLHEAHRLT
jgi:hypothetical protein